MKNILGKIKGLSDSMPCVKSSFDVSTELYRRADDKKPAFNFDFDGDLKIGLLHVLVAALACVALAVVYTASVSAKYKKKYNKKFAKLKKKFEKKEAKLAAEQETEEE